MLNWEGLALPHAYDLRCVLNDGQKIDLRRAAIEGFDAAPDRFRVTFWIVLSYPVSFASPCVPHRFELELSVPAARRGKIDSDKCAISIYPWQFHEQKSPKVYCLWVVKD